jgi:hypothetical protein
MEIFGGIGRQSHSTRVVGTPFLHKKNVSRDPCSLEMRKQSQELRLPDCITQPRLKQTASNRFPYGKANGVMRDWLNLVNEN